MRNSSKLRKNFFYQFGYQILAVIVPLITAPYVTRVLGASGLGEYTYTYTVAYYFYVLCMLGFDTYGQRRIAAALSDEAERNRAFSETITLQVIVTAVGSAVYLFYALHVEGELRTMTLLQFFYLASVFVNIVWVFEGVEEFRAVSLRNSIVKIASTVLIFLLVREEGDLWVYTLIISASALAGNLVFLLDVGKYVRYVKPDLKSMIHELKPVLALFVPQIGITVFMSIDRLMLGWWAESSQLGYYQYAEKIVGVPVALILTVGTVMMPRITSLNASEDNSSIRKYNSLCMEALVLIGAAFSAGIAAVSPIFTPWFFGEGFYGCIPILTLLSFQVVFMAWENVLQKQYLLPLGRDLAVVKAMSIAAAINVVLNVLLIPRYAAMGAIVGSLAAHLFICVYEAVIVSDDLDIAKYVSYVAIYGTCGLAMFGAVRLFLGLIPFESATALVVSGAMFGAVLYCVFVLLAMKLRRSPLLDYLIASARHKGEGRI